jgi:hypothetical protein
MGINKNILWSYSVRLFTGTPEEVLEHSGIAFNCSHGTGGCSFSAKKA